MKTHRALIAAVVLFALAALSGVIALLFPSNTLAMRVFGTAITFGGLAICALGAAIVIEKRRVVPLMYAAVVSAALSFCLWSLLIWDIVRFYDTDIARTAGTQRLAGPEDAAAAPAVHVRAWRVAPEAAVELSFEARLLGAADALRWGTAGSASGRVRWAPEPLALDGAWRDVALRIAPDERASPEVLAFALEVPPGAAVEVRRVRATDAGGVRVAAMAAPARPRAWYGWPNLAGHVVVATAAAGLATARRRVDGGAVALVAAAAVLLTGSRTALAALVVVVAWWAWLAAAPRARVWWAVGGAVLAAVAFGPASGLLGRAGVWTLDDRNVVSRLDQARAAWDALAASPWTGAALPESAHNLWLDLAGGYGVPGLAAAAWLTVGLLVVAWRRAGAPALGAVVGVLTLQLADVSLFFLGVSGPVLLAVAALGDERRAAAGVGEGTGAGAAEGAAGRSIEGAGVP